MVFFLFPNDCKIVFFNIDHESKKAHVRRFGSVLYNCVSDDAVGDNVVKLNKCWNLDVKYLM